MYNTIIPYFGFTQFTPALPEFYWNVYSSEQRIKHICYELCKLAAYDDYIAEQLNLDHETIAELQEMFEKFMESGFDDYYKEQVARWIDENFNRIMGGLIGHMLFFGLTDDGYFTIYIPEMWAIAFDTEMNYDSENYGCLEIKY